MIGNIDFHVKGMSGKKTLAKYKQQPKIRIIIKICHIFIKMSTKNSNEWFFGQNNLSL